MGADAGLVGEALGHMMRNFNIPAEEALVMLEAMSHGATKLELNMTEIGPRLAELTNAMAYWGYSGTDAGQRLIAILGSVKEATGSSTRAAATLTNMFEGLGDPQMAKALGFGTAKELEDHLRGSDDAMGEMVRLMILAEDQYSVMHALGIDNVTVWAKLKNEWKDMGTNIRGVQDATGAYARGMNVLEGAETAVNRLMVSIEELSISLGQLLDTAGATSVFQSTTKEVQAMVGFLKQAVQLWKQLKGEKTEELFDWDNFWHEFRKNLYGDKGFSGWFEKWIGEVRTLDAAKLRRDWAEHQKKRGLNPEGTGPYVPTFEDEWLRQRRLEQGPVTTPKGGRYEHDVSPERFGYPAEKMRYEMNQQTEALKDATVKLIKFSAELPDSNEMRIWKAALGLPGYQAAVGGVVQASARPSEESDTYGGSADVKYLQAAYHRWRCWCHGRLRSRPGGGGAGGGGGGGGGGDGGGGGGAPAGGRGTPYSTGGNAGITAPAGTEIVKTGLATITTSKGRKFQVDARFAANFQGFINDYEAAGGDLGPDTGTLGFRPHNRSGHPIGTAIDINQIGRGVRSKAGRGKTIDPALEDELAEKWGLVSGNRWSDNDQGHFGIRSEEAARAALEKQGGDAPATAGSPLATPSEQEAFAIARAAAVKAGIRDPDTAAAIALHESGFMKRGTGSVFDRSGGTNAFGQTVKRGTPGAIIGADGQPHAKYGSLQEGFDAHFKRWGNRYGATPDETLANLREGGYNTVDPKWAGKIKKIRERNVGAAAVAAAPAAARNGTDECTHRNADYGR